jgi:hypothetical protein
MTATARTAAAALLVGSTAVLFAVLAATGARALFDERAADPRAGALA